MSREHFLSISAFHLRSSHCPCTTYAPNRFFYLTEDEMFTSITRMSTSFRIGLLAVISLIAAIPAYPQQTGTSQAASRQSDNAALQQKIRDLEDRLIALEGQVRLLKSQAAPAPSPAGAPGATAAQAVPAAPTTAAPLSQAQAISLGGAAVVGAAGTA